jgi:hypothetical protein
VPDFRGNALGKKPPLDRPALLARDFLTGVVPVTPLAADHFALVDKWELGGNDRFGTCGPTSVANNLLLTTTYLSTPIRTPVRVSNEAIFDLYRRSGNPGFDPNNYREQDDQGVYVQEMLGALLKDGIGGHKPLAYAKIAPGDMDTLDRAVALFGSVILGLDLKTPQQRQQVWDYAGGAEWGGHAVLSGLYSNPAGNEQDRTGIVTWAEVVEMTRTFVANQEDEAWVIIWPEHLDSHTFLEGVDVNALASAYEELTGRPFPDYAPTPPQPPAFVDVRLAEALERYLSHHKGPHYLEEPARAWLAARG